MSENPVGDELKTEQKQKEQEEDEKDKLLSLSEEEQPPDEEDDALLNKEKSFIFESRMEDADLLRKRGNENLGNNLLQEAETDYRRGLFHLDMDLLQVKSFHCILMFCHLESDLTVCFCYIHH